MRRNSPPPAAQSMATKGEENRARIVATANQLFYTRGFAETSFADIAREAGIPKGNFYFYFPSKDNLLAAVIDARIERLRALLGRFEEEFADPRDRLKRLADVPLNDFGDVTRYGCPMGTLTTELAKQQNAMSGHARKMFTLILDWAARQFRLLPGADADALSRQLLIRLQGACAMAQAYQDPNWLTDEVGETRKWIDAL